MMVLAHLPGLRFYEHLARGLVIVLFLAGRAEAFQAAAEIQETEASGGSALSGEEAGGSAAIVPHDRGQRPESSVTPEDRSAQKSKTRKEADRSIFARWSLEQRYGLLLSAAKGKIIEGALNPRNTAYRLPEATVLTELRPDIKARYTRKTSIVLRPRVRWEGEDTAGTSGHEKRQETRATMNEGYIAIAHSPTLQSVTGLQNFQWGPAELYSPSNPYFRDLGLEKNFFSETRGEALIRLNYTPFAQSSLILLYQPVDNGAARPRSAGPFRQRAALKAEYADATQTDYLGVVISTAEKERLHLGVYANYEIAPGASCYLDASSRQGSRTAYGSLPDEVPALSATRSGDRSWTPISLVGLRYAGEGGIDLRLEYLHDGEGWTSEERAAAGAIVFSQPIPRHVELFAAPGSILAGRDFLYPSLRIPEWGWGQSLNLSLRALFALQDGSRALQANLDTYLNEHITLSTGLSERRGVDQGILRAGASWAIYGAGAYAW